MAAARRERRKMYRLRLSVRAGELTVSEVGLRGRDLLKSFGDEVR
jgi:hypothetical protein